MKKKLNILIVEDDRTTSRIIEKFLKNLGYNPVAIITTGEEAIEKSLKMNPDMVLMDITLEGTMDGIETAKNLYESLNIPSVYITTSSDDETISRAKVSNPYGFIIKPIDIKELKASIEMAMLRYNMENRLIESEEKYSTILKSIGDAVVVVDHMGTITYMNPVAENMTGIIKKDAMGKDMKSVIRVEVEDINPVEISGSNPGNGIRNYLVSSDRTRIPIDFSTSIQMDKKENSIGSVMIFRDVTERIKSEDRLHKTLKILRNAMGGVIQAISQTVETRDPYTAGHQRRVSNIAQMIAEKIGLDSDRIEGIRMSGIIHDLGKLSIPAEILSKPGKISEVEFNLIKSHPQTGYDILKSIEFPWPIADIVHQHHERIDGSGYPHGLRGDEIMLESKIISVADVVEAMASHRPYRPSLGIEFTLEELTKNRGIKYDAGIVDHCIKIFTDDKLTMEDF